MTILNRAGLMTALLLGVLSTAAPQAPATGIIEGVVLRLGTSEPLADVKVSVSPVNETWAGASQSRPSVLSAITDSSGRFTVNDVPLGNAFVRAELPGYFAPLNYIISEAFVESRVTLTADKAIDVRFSLTPGATIAGRVLDSNGKPMINVTVKAQWGLCKNDPLNEWSVVSRTTDDRGEYRLFRVPPGEYYVTAKLPLPAGSDPPLPGIESPPGSRTFYPSAISYKDAIPVSVGSGEEKYGIDIRVQTISKFRVSGRVLSTLPNGPVVRTQTTTVAAAGTLRSPIAELSLVSREGCIGGSITRTAKEDNTFEFRDIPPGSYDLVANLPATVGWGTLNPPGLALNSWAFGRTVVEVRDSNVDSVDVVVHQGVDLNGAVLVDGRPLPALLRVQVFPDDGVGGIGGLRPFLSQVAQFQPAIAADGRFTIPMLPEGRYLFEVVLGEPPQVRTQSARADGTAAAIAAVPQTGLPKLPDTAYLADIRQAGSSVYDNGLNVGQGAMAPVEVLIRTDGGNVDGIVTDGQQKAVANAFVALVPASSRQNSARFKTTHSDAQGRFALPATQPGSYKLFASQHELPLDAYQDPLFLSKIENFGLTVTVPSSSAVRVNVALMAIP